MLVYPICQPAKSNEVDFIFKLNSQETQAIVWHITGEEPTIDLKEMGRIKNSFFRSISHYFGY